MAAPIYLQLNKGGTPARMANLRMVAEQSKIDNRPPSIQLADWRAARKYGFGTWRDAYGELSQGFNGEGYARREIWYCHTGEQFRNECDANDIDNSPVDHLGWFADIHQDEKAIGIVGMLSHGRYVAGYRWTSNGERVYFSGIYTDAIDAARAADSHAESFADTACEDSEKWEAARKLEIDIEDSLTRLRECLALRHQKCMNYVRGEALELVETIRGARESLRTDYANYC